MSNKKYFNLDILTPNGIAFSERVISLKAPGTTGLFGVLLNHIPSFFLLKKGLLEVQAIGGNKKFAISGGVADVSEHYVQIITTSAQLVED